MLDNDPQYGLTSRLRSLLPTKGQTLSGTATELLEKLGKDVLPKDYNDSVAARELSRMLNRPMRGFRATQNQKVWTVTALADYETE